MSQISKQALIVDNSQSFPDNNSGQITPSDLRAFNVNMIDSLVNEIPYQSFTASVTNSINLLSAFTASIQPDFNSLNQFTASQQLLNDGYTSNISTLFAADESMNSKITQLQTWSGSVNEIRFNNGIPQYATRWNFGGFISASFVENVGGRIADITVLQDPTKVNTSSFNDYTQSTNVSISYLNQFTASINTSSLVTSVSNLNQFTASQQTTNSENASRFTRIEQTTASLNAFTASQNTFNNSITSSVQQLLDLSSSLSGGYATQGELDAVSSSLNTSINSLSSSLTNTINTKLNTSSFNAFTQSQNNLNVTYATTGSNTFIGNQIISGTFVQSGSNSIAVAPNGASVGTWIQNRVLISGPGSGETPRLFISGSDGAFTEMGRGFISQDTRAVTTLSANVYSVSNLANTSVNSVAVSNDDFSTYYEMQMFANTSSVGLSDWDNGSTFNYVPFMTLAPNLGNNPSPNFVRGLKSTGTTIITGSIEITGSIKGNIVSASIVSNTASIDLSKGTYFTLTLPASSSTNINLLNPAAGETALLKIVNAGNNATASFSSNVKQPSTGIYVPTDSGTDIITFAAWDSSNVFATAIVNMI